MEEEPSAEEQPEAAEEEDPAYALYNKFIEDLKNGGVIDDVDDSGGPADGPTRSTDLFPEGGA